MNSALYSWILLANPTIIHENRTVLRVLTILLLLSRKDWRGKRESTVDATPSLWQPVTVGCECGLSCVGRHGNAGSAQFTWEHSTCVSPALRALWALLFCKGLCARSFDHYTIRRQLCALYLFKCQYQPPPPPPPLPPLPAHSSTQRDPL